MSALSDIHQRIEVRVIVKVEYFVRDDSPLGQKQIKGHSV